MDGKDEANVSYGLVVSFEDQSPSYVHGFEAGTLKVRMCGDAPADDIDGEKITVHTANRVTIDRMCAAYGWQALWEGTEFPEWSYLTLTRSPKPTERPNPYGLRVVPSSPSSDFDSARARGEAKRRFDTLEWEGSH